ncbi:hypothetical protein M5K25_003580 [Dendrobium thyrsiflorum]|uniref:Uncharacterized protein n=1 Tax=Dendrobium thyrsiflorum TaxID=117978 RepID=A0ABD0VKL4_DENTH
MLLEGESSAPAVQALGGGRTPRVEDISIGFRRRWATRRVRSEKTTRTVRRNILVHGLMNLEDGGRARRREKEKGNVDFKVGSSVDGREVERVGELVLRKRIEGANVTLIGSGLKSHGGLETRLGESVAPPRESTITLQIGRVVSPGSGNHRKSFPSSSLPFLSSLD